MGEIEERYYSIRLKLYIKIYNQYISSQDLMNINQQIKISK